MQPRDSLPREYMEGDGERFCGIAGISAGWRTARLEARQGVGEAANQPL